MLDVHCTHNIDFRVDVNVNLHKANKKKTEILQSKIFPRLKKSRLPYYTYHYLQF